MIDTFWHEPLTAKPDLPQGCAVYLVDVVKHPLPADQAASIVNPEEKKRADRFRLGLHQHRYVQCHAMTRLILGQLTGVPAEQIRYRFNSYGKPEFTGDAEASGITFNISHSGDLAVIAVATGNSVGVDIEQKKNIDNIDSLTTHFFAEAESHSISQLRDDEKSDAFFACWSRKESFIKAMGLGLSMPLDSFTVNVEPDEPAVLTSIDYKDHRIDDWNLFTLVTPPGYSGALTLKRA